MNSFIKVSAQRTAILVTALAALAVAGCASGPRIYSNESPAADFSAYRTFTFAEELGTDNGKPYRSLLSQFLVAEVSEQLEARGYEIAETGPADIVIDFAVGEQEKIRSTPGTSFGGFYGRGYYPYYPGYYGGFNDGPEIRQYTESTISVSMVDTGTNQVVWEGASINRMTDELRNNLQLSVEAAVADMFSRFPHYASGTRPPALAQDGATI